MDIVRRAYLKAREEVKISDTAVDLLEKVRVEIIRLIWLRAYGTRDWPRELGPLPEELRKKGQARELKRTV